MSKYQAMKEAVEIFQPNAAEAPFLYSMLEVNEKGFQVLLGRKVKPPPFFAAAFIFVLIIIAVTILSIISFIYKWTPLVSFMPSYIILFITVFYYYRKTLIFISENGLDFYFIESKLGSKYIAYDKISLSYYRITNIKIKTGKYNTNITFEFSKENKSYKIKAAVPNKVKKMNEQAENFKYLFEALKKYIKSN